MRTTVYQVGDQVIPVDLPRRLVCRVEEACDLALEGGGQILMLRPLDGPWEQGTTLVRLDVAVRPAGRPQCGRGRAQPTETPSRVPC